MSISKKQWFLLATAVASFGLVGVALLALGLLVGFFAGNETAQAASELPVYTPTQTASSHTGYRRTTLTVGTETYVNDFEEYALGLVNMDPQQAIARSALANGKVCAIANQPTSAYVAADVGSEMPAYEVFRNSRQPPFDWRTASFRELQFTRPNYTRDVLRSTDPALVAAVVRTLREGATVAPPTPVSSSLTTLSAIILYSDQVPGLAFQPSVYFDPTGPVYLAENISILPSKNNTVVYAHWVVANPQLAAWLKGSP